MKKLTLEILSAYLPFKLKVKHQSGPIMEMTAERMQGDSLSIASVLDGIGKPILRPLSQLTEQITHKGETFVPIERIKKEMPNTPNFYWLANGSFPSRDLSESIIEYCVMQKLIEWHFDVFGLISDGLAVAKTN